MPRSAQYKHSQRTSAGADKWLHVTSHDTTQAALRHLRASGFQIVVTHLGPSSVSIQVSTPPPAHQPPHARMCTQVMHCLPNELHSLG
jgi:tRNA G18 (ribose-2'-O)-methylase SpoU